jgi:hypothetical protein
MRTHAAHLPHLPWRPSLEDMALQEAEEHLIAWSYLPLSKERIAK